MGSIDLLRPCRVVSFFLVLLVLCHAFSSSFTTKRRPRERGEEKEINGMAKDLPCLCLHTKERNTHALAGFLPLSFARRRSSVCLRWTS